MLDQFHNGFNGNYFFGLYLLGLLYIWTTEKKMRLKLVIPSLLLTLLILNPVCYRYIWSHTLRYSYWRIFWTIPVILTIAYAAVDMISHIQRPGKKIFAAVYLGLLCLFSGAFVYANEETGFSAAENVWKLPASDIAIANELQRLEPDDIPRIVTDGQLAAHIRQISPRIQMAYGRWGERMGTTGRKTARCFYDEGFGDFPISTDFREDFDWEYAYACMQEEGFNYLLLPTAEETAENGGDRILLDAGFVLESYAGGYGIYSVEGEVE
ncbi:MAG: hypothetical protein Q4B22_02290 [Eubacteriales bacterium]|nr:hypothetical protein [Eubacteriales bacterium]